MAHVSERSRAYGRVRGHNPLLAPFLLFVGLIVFAAVYVAYVLWPRWPGGPVAVEAPALPIVIGGTMFNVEPAAIRRAVQRKAGAQERIDLAYLWPSLTPPDGKAPDAEHPIDPNERLFLTIADGRDALAPLERIKTIYPRYLAGTASSVAEGLNMREFRDGTPYQGEDFVYAESDPDFAARCTRSGIGNSGMCLLQRRFSSADVTVRFPRDWLADWKKVLYGIDRVIARLHPAN